MFLSTLWPGKLAALAGLGALRHLDLDVVGIDQIFGRHAEAARRHLLDAPSAWNRRWRSGLKRSGSSPPSPVLERAADAVHRDGQIGVRLAADRAEAHRAGGEALDDLGRRLDLVERDRLVGQLELHQPAQGQQPLALLVDACRRRA